MFRFFISCLCKSFAFFLFVCLFVFGLVHIPPHLFLQIPFSFFISSACFASPFLSVCLLCSSLLSVSHFCLFHHSDLSFTFLSLSSSVSLPTHVPAYFVYYSDYLFLFWALFIPLFLCFLIFLIHLTFVFWMFYSSFLFCPCPFLFPSFLLLHIYLISLPLFLLFLSLVCVYFKLH